MAVKAQASITLFQVSDVDSDEINGKFEDINGNIIEVQEQLSTDISAVEESIRLEASEKYYTKDEAETFVGEVNTILEQNSEGWEFQFNEIKANFDELNDTSNQTFAEWQKYIRFHDGNIILGQVGNEIELHIENDRISFIENGIEVAYLSNSKLNITNADVNTQLGIGKFAFIPRANGSLDFKKVGN